MMIPHLYIHVPFCTSKCHYCAFYSEIETEKSIIAEYPELLQRELILRKQNSCTLSPRTIYMGGGTPSLLRADGFRKLSELLQESIEFDQLEEWSVEINPASATPDLFQSMRRCGVNRITFGAQSFNDVVLEKIGRAHPAERTHIAIEQARNAGFSNIGIDLIAGLPEADKATWQEDLHTALSLSPKHISIYSLSVEQGTKMEEMVTKGVPVADIEEQFERLHEAEKILTKAGFIRYEISNYALPGYECQHNLGIWRGDDYLGLGPAAASRLKLNRMENHPDLKLWREKLLHNKVPPNTCESTSEEDDALQRVLFRFRLKEGFNPDECIQLYPILGHRKKSWQKSLTCIADNGAIKQKDGRWSLTKRGLEVCDYVIRELM